MTNATMITDRKDTKAARRNRAKAEWKGMRPSQRTHLLRFISAASWWNVCAWADLPRELQDSIVEVTI